MRREDPAPGDEDDQVDGLGDQTAWYGDDGFLDELLDAVEGGARRIGVNRGDAAGMAGVPCLQHVEGFRAPDFADDDAVGPEPQRRAYEIGQRDRAPSCPERNAVLGSALQLARVLDQDHPLVAFRDFGQQRIGERGLARRRAAGDQDVAPLAHGLPQRIGLQRQHDAVGDIVGQRVEFCGRLADGEAWRQHDRRQQPLEALARAAVRR